MNKEELENAFNETTENAVKVINDYKELIVKYNIMKENAETLAKRIDKAIEYIEHRQEDINNGGNEHEYKSNEFIINILKGSDKE